MDIPKKDYYTDSNSAKPNCFHIENVPWPIKIYPDRVHAICKLSIDRGGTIRSEQPLPINQFFYYFEVDIIKLKKKITIGMIHKNFDPKQEIECNNMSSSFGYGTDGAGTNQQKLIFPRSRESVKDGDVLGCGILFNYAEMFFTQNGKIIDGMLFENIESAHYAAVSLGGLGDEIKVNFGQKKFACENVNKIVKNLCEDYMRRIMIKPSLEISDNLVSSFVSEYLIHHGYHQTLSALENKPNVDLTTNTSESRKKIIETMLIRRQVSDFILDGKPQKALNLVRKNFGNLDSDIDFALRCQIFSHTLLEKGLEPALLVAEIELKPYLAPHWNHVYDDAVKNVLSHIAFCKIEKNDQIVNDVLRFICKNIFKNCLLKIVKCSIKCSMLQQKTSPKIVRIGKREHFVNFGNKPL
ncbi:hypothetical protein MHBO_001069 [Bonamia ostreae]|uniref:Uncharacterized protein n=1 Tax=Bonamia ostreae TaxID=126728 RepID=A0ABV2AI85_9EUKA